MTDTLIYLQMQASKFHDVELKDKGLADVVDLLNDTRVCLIDATVAEALQTEYKTLVEMEAAQAAESFATSVVIQMCQGKCKAMTKHVTVSMQDSAGDEGTTKYYMCMECTERYRQRA
jgi:DNA-directed RNA polymerase subunit M/transcription elongation factor TFIIS